VQEAARSVLTSWQNFYVIIGSASAALTGLMFVVVTLIANLHTQQASEAVGAFGTPNVVHFCMALLISATLTAPWPLLWHPGLLLGLIGLGGMAYILIVLRRALRQNDYQPVLEDWLWHTIFPFLSYASLVGAAIELMSYPVPALFAIAAATVLLLFIGIHNAWDAVTYLITTRLQPQDKSQD
jgi:hypothetical protein